MQASEGRESERVIFHIWLFDQENPSKLFLDMVVWEHM